MITILNKYYIYEIIGSGSFGDVFCGEHIRNKEKVAIKIAKQQFIINILKHEAKIYNKLN